METSTTGIATVGRIIVAISKHIVAERALAGTGVTVCVDETTPLGVIVAGLEVIQPGVYGTLLTTGPFLA